MKAFANSRAERRATKAIARFQRENGEWDEVDLGFICDPTKSRRELRQIRIKAYRDNPAWAAHQYKLARKFIAERSGRDKISMIWKQRLVLRYCRG